MRIPAELLENTVRALEKASCQNPEECSGQWKAKTQKIVPLCPRCRALYEINQKLRLATDQEVQP